MPTALESLKQSFQAEGQSPQFWVNAPGRVNIIGEHTDHQYYGVLPTCINRSIKIVGTLDPSTHYVLKLTNEDPTFEDIVFEDYDAMHMKKGSWGNYAVSAYTGLMEYMSPGMECPSKDYVGRTVNCQAGETCAKIASTSVIPKGITLKVSSDLPAAAGVSSSSALTVAFIRAFIDAIVLGPHGAEFKVIRNQTNLYQSEKIAEFSVPAERHCGTASGGMDQAIICLGKEGIALNINFHPLIPKQVDLPKCMELIVANTGKKSAKAEMAPFMYNKRVFELRLGNLLLLEAGLREASEDQENFKVPEDILAPDYLPRLRDVERRLQLSYSQLIKLCENNLKDEYHRDELCDKFAPEKIANLLQLSGEAVLEKNDTFKLKQPICHVLSETIRVDQFVETCAEAKEKAHQPEVTAKLLGQLMDESHFSLRDQFYNSCPELESVTTIARDAGAYGARMTGAGWGGCAVIAVHSEDAQKVKQALLENYYVTTIQKQIDAGDDASTVLPTSNNVNFELLKDTCFVVAPSHCADSGYY